MQITQFQCCHCSFYHFFTGISAYSLAGIHILATDLVSREENAVLAPLEWVFAYNSATVERVIDQIWSKTDK